MLTWFLFAAPVGSLLTADGRGVIAVTDPKACAFAPAVLMEVRLQLATADRAEDGREEEGVLFGLNVP